MKPGTFLCYACVEIDLSLLACKTESSDNSHSQNFGVEMYWTRNHLREGQSDGCFLDFSSFQKGSEHVSGIVEIRG